MKTLLEGGSFFEAPRWRAGRWWVSDFFRHRVVTVDPGGREEHVLDVEGRPSGLGWMPDGSLLVVSMTDHRVLRRRPDGEVALHAHVGKLCGGYLNDMVVDSDGRAYAGEFGFDLDGHADPEPANLLRIDPDGTASIAAEDMLFPNGSVITPDGRTLIVGETAGARYTAFDIEAERQAAHEAVLVTTTVDAPHRPTMIRFGLLGPVTPSGNVPPGTIGAAGEPASSVTVHSTPGGSWISGGSMQWRAVRNARPR